MSRYLRPRLPGVPIFFTVALAQRGSRLLVEQVDALRDAVRVTRAERPFGIEAWVVLPDHLHCVWRLPEGDCDYGVRWGAIKARFSRAVRGTVGWNPPYGRRTRWRRGMPAFGSGGFGSITFAMTKITRRICGIVDSIR